MNARQEAKLMMYRAVEKHCDDNSSIISAVLAFQTAFNSFKTKIADIVSTTQLKDLSLAGITADKGNSKQTLAQIAADIAGFIYAYASITDNNALKQEVNFNVSKLIQTRDDQLAPRCQNIHAKGVANLDALKDYGVTTAKLTELQTAIDNYSANTPKPRTALSQRKTLQSNLARLFKEADTILVEQMDKLVGAFRSANPDFVTAYESNRIIVDPATTTTQLKGTVTNNADGTPIRGALVTIVELSKTAATDSLGKYLFKPIANGKYTMTVSATGFESFQADNVEVKLGAVNSLNVELLLD